MIVVVAARSDLAAQALVERWPRDLARVLTVDDLATAGWRVGSGRGARAVVRGDIVPVGRIGGVLTRLPAVTEGELPMIVPEDRAYAANEMTAFLSYWLSTLDCPLLNPPSTTTLCGPGWRTERWLLAASELGIPTRSTQRRVPLFDNRMPPEPRGKPALETVTVVGDRWVGAADDGLVGWAQALAAAARVDLLSVQFVRTEQGPRFYDATPWANVNDAQVASAILGHMTGGERR